MAPKRGDGINWARVAELLRQIADEIDPPTTTAPPRKREDVPPTAKPKKVRRYPPRRP